MTAWADYKTINVGDQVQTPQGIGTLRRINKESGFGQVDIDGQLFEIHESGVNKIPSGTPAPASELRTGDRVQKVDNPNSTGIVTEVTQRRVQVKWSANGKTADFVKGDASKYIKKSPAGEEPRSLKDEPGVPEQAKPAQVQSTGDALGDLMQLKQHMEQRIDQQVDGELAELRDMVQKSRKLEVIVNGNTGVINGLKHNQLEQLISYAALRLSPMLVGMAGTGKTHASEQVSTALGLPFYSMSVGAQTSKSDIIGYMSASGDYIQTHFRQAYENGGVFLMDEIDAGNANVLIQVNAALSNGLCAFPDSMVKRHDDFVFVASANTYGNGANRQYVGRNQLDAATLDRFAIVDWLIDDELESSLAVGLNGKAWYMAVRAARDYVAEKNIRALISPRATQKGSKLLNIGQDLQEVIDATMLASVPDDKRKDVSEVATKVFEKFASEVKKQLPYDVSPPTAADLVRDL